jgi:hypothetical protein
VLSIESQDGRSVLTADRQMLFEVLPGDADGPPEETLREWARQIAKMFRDAGRPVELHDGGRP